MRAAVLLALASVVLAPGCATNQCSFHSQCGTGHYCRAGRCMQDCRRDFDCSGGQVCSEIGQCGPPQDGQLPEMPDGGHPPIDGGHTPPIDGGHPPPPIDGGHPPPPIDGGRPIDTGPPPGVGRYLDRCRTDGDCATGHCVDDVGVTRMCTIACARHSDCASEHVCAGGLCRPDDTGVVCNTASPGSCVLGLCIGNSTTTVGHCTRECSSAADCPAGFACTDAGGTRVCVDIERSCADASACPSGMCLSLQGCTSTCTSDLDCPQRFPFLPAYRCMVAFGSTSPICVPPTDIIGADPIGTSCPATGTNSCRSDACDTSAPTGPMCTQSCTQEGGCGPALGCFPEVDTGEIYLLCSRAGSGALGSACSSGRQCASGLCDATFSFCTRLCTDDGLCPTGQHCEPIPGFGLSFCRR